MSGCSLALLEDRNHDPSPNQLEKKESPSRCISNKMESSAWLGHWWGQPKQVIGQREGLGLGKRAVSLWHGVSPLILGYSEGSLWQMALSQEVQELSTGALVL